jgi:hypothetical protein
VEDDDADRLEPAPLPQRVVIVAYLLAALCMLIPLAFVGAAFAGVVLIRRGRAVDGYVVLALGALGVAIAVTALR